MENLRRKLPRGVKVIKARTGAGWCATMNDFWDSPYLEVEEKAIIHILNSHDKSYAITIVDTAQRLNMSINRTTRYFNSLVQKGYLWDNGEDGFDKVWKLTKLGKEVNANENI